MRGLMSCITNCLHPSGAIHTVHALWSYNTRSALQTLQPACTYPFSALLAAFSCKSGGVKLPAHLFNAEHVL